MDKNKYLETVAEQIRCKRAVPFLKQELKDHIEDQMEAYIADGMNPEEAEEAAVREMGNPVETGVELDRVHRPKMDRKVLLGAIFLGVLGIIIQAMILSTVYKEQMGPEYSAPYHIYALDEIMEQAAITLGGIVTMLAVCYLDYSRLFKHTRKIWIGLNVLLILICVFDFALVQDNVLHCGVQLVMAKYCRHFLDRHSVSDQICRERSSEFVRMYVHDS